MPVERGRGGLRIDLGRLRARLGHREHARAPCLGIEAREIGGLGIEQLGGEVREPVRDLGRLLEGQPERGVAGESDPVDTAGLPVVPAISRNPSGLAFFGAGVPHREHHRLPATLALVERWLVWMTAGLLVACGPEPGDPFEDGGAATSTGGVANGDDDDDDPAGGGGAADDAEGGGSNPTTGVDNEDCQWGLDGWGDGNADPSGGFDEGGGSSGGNEGDTFGMDDDFPIAASVPDVQQGFFDPGELVELSQLVVTSPVGSSATGAQRELFVQDPAGGVYSGILVRFDVAPVAEAMLVPGRLVDVVGEIRGQDGHVLIHVLTSGFSTIAVGGMTAEPPPEQRFAEELTPDAPDARALDGVLVEILEPLVTDEEACMGEFVVDDTVRVDDRFTDLPVVSAGGALGAIRGPLTFAGDRYEIAPRTAADVQ